jgi:phage gpG-like protein
VDGDFGEKNKHRQHGDQVSLRLPQTVDVTGVKAVDVQAFVERMGLLAAVGADVKPALAASKSIALDGVRQSFMDASSPSGQAWPARKRIGDGHPLLRESGALLEAAAGTGPGHVDRIENGDTQVLGVDKSVERGGIPGAAVHQFSFPPRNIPARPYEGFSNQTLDRMEPAIANALADQL